MASNAVLADQFPSEQSSAIGGVDSNEIVVTATRSGAQSIQNVPISVTALNPEALQRQGNDALSDISRAVPGLFIQEQGGGQNKIVMRGINATSGINQTDTAENALVSVYLDDVPISIQGSTPDIRVYDLERVEFLRGPQGTLFGAGAMAGTVRYITRKPGLSSFEGSAEGSLATTRGGDNSYSVRGMINVPLVTDQLGLRVTAYRGKDGGYIDNVVGADNFNDLDMTQVRSIVRYQNQSNFTADLSYLYGNVDSSARSFAYDGLEEYEFQANNPSGLKDRFHIFNFAPQLEIGSITLFSSTSYISRKYTFFDSQEFFSAGLLGLDTPEAAALTVNDITDFTQEFRVTTDQSRPLRVQLGAFYERQTRHYDQSNVWPGLDSAFGIDSLDFFAEAPDQIFRSDTNTKTKQLAFFGEVAYSPVPALDLTAGLRYFDWSQHYTLLTAGLAGVDASGQPLTLAGDSKANGFNPRAAASYHVTDDVMIYAEAARGFRYGGINQVVPLDFCGPALAAQGLAAAPIDFGPDKLWSYTIGEKAQFLDRKVTLNVAAFLANWNDVQTRRNLDSCGYNFTENSGRIRSKGLEIESRVQPTDNLSLTASGSYTDAKTRDINPNIAPFAGARVPYFPKYIMSIGAEYEIPLKGTNLILQGDYTYRSSTGTRFNPADLGYRTIPASNVFNAAITLEADSFSVSLFAKNLTDEYVIQGIYNNAYPAIQPGDTLTVGRPRTVGLRVKKQF
ncbi:TonB-dependent receptor [Sphingosinicella microcystinivorans]|nr:TonB-dependent receptor [Sphingosinicella microcystinivorans]